MEDAWNWHWLFLSASLGGKAKWDHFSCWSKAVICILQLLCLRTLVWQNKVLCPPDLVSLPSCVSFQNAKALKAKKEDGNKAFKKGNYKLAYELYTEALGIDPNNIKTNAKLYCNRGTVNSKVRDVHLAGVCCQIPQHGCDKPQMSYSGKHSSPGCWAAASLRPWAVFQGFVLAQHLDQFPTASSWLLQKQNSNTWAAWSGRERRDMLQPYLSQQKAALSLFVSFPGMNRFIFLFFL